MKKREKKKGERVNEERRGRGRKQIEEFLKNKEEFRVRLEEYSPL